MVIASYTCQTSLYEVRLIEDESFIDADTEAVKEFIGDMDITIYKDNMRTSVSQGLAYAVFKDGLRLGFVYNRITDEGHYYGCSIKVMGEIVGMVIAIKTMFDITTHHKLTFVPHKGNLRYFKSMIRGDVIRAHHAGMPTVTITKETMLLRGLIMFEYLRIEPVL